MTSGLDNAMLRDIETTAVELARVAGAEIVSALGGLLAVSYKNAPVKPDDVWRDPVSEVDQKVETMIRARLAERFPGHDIMGEESEERPGRGSDFVWAVDPVDGTTNFINGFPMFAASIGVVHRGRPVAGALWCAASHALRAGVYHAREGGRLHFDGAPLERRENPAVRRRLGGDPLGAADKAYPWELRKTGSAAIECAFVAAGLLRVARFEQPNLWDIAGGVALVHAAGCRVMVREEGAWKVLERFEVGADLDLRSWRRPLILGEAEAVALLAAA
jgi:myo-inositol-1(or 4)-monophosphatase